MAPASASILMALQRRRCDNARWRAALPQCPHQPGPTMSMKGSPCARMISPTSKGGPDHFLCFLREWWTVSGTLIVSSGFGKGCRVRRKQENGLQGRQGTAERHIEKIPSSDSRHAYAHKTDWRKPNNTARWLGFEPDGGAETGSGDLVVVKSLCIFGVCLLCRRFRCDQLDERS
jgi:hypothetical protein